MTVIHAGIAARVVAILNDHPRLHLWGNGNPGQLSRINVPAAREELLHETTLRDILAAAQWCARRLVPAKPNISDLSTYYWKHVYERHTDDGLYLPSGAFAVAAAIAGLPLDWAHYNPIVHAAFPGGFWRNAEVPGP
ncbi:hypothetical protein [Pseudarthrobacter sp.]|uniref:hypothetical protein n=1 Tax=Pseudarthrobacter sp. TaxID=1934409 RepID=UPI002FC828E4